MGAFIVLKSNEQHSWPRRLQWHAESFFYRTIEGALGMLSAPTVAWIGERLGEFAGHLLVARRRVVRRNLRIAFAGEKSRTEIDAMVMEVFRRTGANLISSIRTAALDDAGLLKAIRIENPELVEHALEGGKGAVVVLAHMGNWEAIAQIFPRVFGPRYAAATVYRPLNNPILNERVEAVRKRTGVRLFKKNDNAMILARFLREGGALGILSDQRALGIGETVPFFGRLTVCTPMPAVLARRTGAAVLGLSLKTIAPGRWSMKFHESHAPEPNTAACMQLLEEIVRESPEDVFWLQDRWKVSRIQPQNQPGKLMRGAANGPKANKPRRCLLWVVDATCPPPDLRTVAPDDLEFEYVLPAEVTRPAWIPEGGRIHRQPVRSSRSEIARVLGEIDEAGELPIEFVYAPGASRKVIKAAGVNGLAVIQQPGGVE